MSSRTTLTAFLATAAVAIPAGWRVLDADIQTDGKRVRPMQQAFTVDGARVTLEVDRGLVMTGDSVTAKLVAYSDTPKRVALEMRVTQSSNYEGERVEQPEIAIDHEKLTLDAAPGGGKPFLTRIKLGTKPDRIAVTDDFKIYVAAVGKKPSKEDDTDAPPAAVADEAAVTVHGWSGDNLGISIEPQGHPVVGMPFTVKVRVKNTSGRTLHPPWVSLATQLAGSGWAESGTDFDVTPVDEAATPDGEAPWKRGAVWVKKFVITPKDHTHKQITLVGSAIVGEGIGPTLAGAMDARTFTLDADPNPTVAEN
ncbi:MAG: hypothetical protein JWO36_6428 [Myxococcales bacterium]|nr:hypothetical protein [Myxococcales bacterium]